jgi:hypothetical protein
MLTKLYATGPKYDKLWLSTPVTNTIAGELLHKCVKKGIF